MAKDRTLFKATTKAHHCPVCEGNHKCSIGKDGLIVCGRGQGPQQGFVHLGAAKGDPQYNLYRRGGDPVLEARQAEYEAAYPHKANGHAQDWPRLASEFVAALSPARRDELATTLGVPPNVLSALSVGWSNAEGCWTFPERDGTGKIIGINRRWPDGKKKAMAGSQRGLYLPPAWRQRGRRHRFPFDVAAQFQECLKSNPSGLLLWTMAINKSVDNSYERNGQAEQGSSATVVHLVGREALAGHWQVSGCGRHCRASRDSGRTCPPSTIKD